MKTKYWYYSLTNPWEVTDIPTTLSKDWVLEGRQMAEIFWLNVKGYKIIINATAHIKKLYTNLIQNEQSNIIIYIIFYVFFPFGMKSLIYNLPRLSFSKSLQINVFQCPSNYNCILSVTKKIKKGKFWKTKRQTLHIYGW